MAKNKLPCHCWGRAESLEPIISDSTLGGADADVLRQHFKTMRERNAIPERIARECFWQWIKQS
jgi:hypothetical protein